MNSRFDMTVDDQHLARRFAALSPEARRGFLARLEEAGLRFAELPIVAADRERQDGCLPLSPAQRSLWLTWKLDPASGAYNLSGLLRLRGRLDTQALQAAIQGLLQRHEVLRTLYVSEDEGEPLQRILQDDAVQIVVADLRGRSPQAGEPTESQLQQAFAQQPFQLDAERPIRFALWRSGEEEYALGISLHHIAGDGWSLQVLVQDFLALYRRACGEAVSGLEPLAVQFADYAVWQRNGFEAGEKERQLAYWRDRLAEGADLLPLPTDHARGGTGAAGDGAAGEARRVFVLPAPLGDALRTLAREQQASLFMVVLALYQLLLCRFSGQADIRVGSPLAHRQRAETHALVGYLTNLQVLCTRVDLAGRFADLVAAVRATVLDAQLHPDLPFDMLVEALQPVRQAGVHPLIQVKCTQQEDMAARWQLPGLEVALESIAGGDAHFDLSLDFTDRPAGIEIALIYNAALFEAGTMERLERHFLALARQVVERPGALLRELEAGEPVAPLEGEDRAWPQADVLQLWDAAVARVPHRTAVRDADRSLAYAGLDALADGLAQRMRAQGVGPGARVAIHIDRSCDFVLAVLAVLKAGAAYVPLDPQLPMERLSFQLRDSQASLLLAVHAPAWAADLPCLQVHDAAPDLAPAPLHTGPKPPSHVPWHPQQPAYLIYTSGSTGRPKGVVVGRGALAQYVQAVLQRLDLPDEATEVAMVSTVAADLGHTSLFGALCSGRSLHLIDAACAFDPDRFADYMARHGIDMLKIVPSHLQALLAAGRPADVLPASRLVLGGEATRWPLVAQIAGLKPGCRVLNHYGPTETTVGILTQEADEAARHAASLPVGRPLANSLACVLDAMLQPVPVGGCGELYLGGPALACGYQSRPGQTAERFVASPQGGGGRLYRTGDRVRRLGDGALEFLGRVDDQVKIRGYRVELGEVAQALRALQGVAQAEVIVREGRDGAPGLQAFVVAGPGPSLDAAGLLARLATRLPNYMVPASVMVLDALPLTANGKLDRSALQAMVAATTEAGTQGVEAPVGEVEQTLAAVWSEVLGRESIGRQDQFFEIGGDSILALKAVAKARKRGLKLLPKHLFEPVSLQRLAEILGGATATAPSGATGCAAPAAPVAAAEPAIPALDPALRGQPLPLSHAQLRQWFLWQLDPQGSAYHITGALRLSGTLDLDALQRSFEDLVERHDSLRTVFGADADGQVWQQVRAVAELPPMQLPLIDGSGLPEDRREAHVQAQALQVMAMPFDLTRGPLLRLAVVRASQREHVLVVVMHHIVSDGWSMQIIVDEFAQRYRARLLGQATAPVPLPLQYADYAVWHRQWLEDGEGQRQLAYWKRQLGDEHPVMQLPSSRPRRADGRYRAARHAMELSPGRLQGLQRRAQAQGMSLFMVLLAGFQALLHRFSGMQDIRVGVPTANRHRSEIQGVVGFFVNTQVMRGQLQGRMTLAELLAQVRERAVQAQDHQDLPFEQLVEALHPQRSLSVSPLFQVMFNHQRKGHEALQSLPGLSVQGHLDMERSTLFELMLDTVEWEGGGLSIQFSYAAELFDADMVARLATGFDRLLAALADHPGVRLSEVDILDTPDLDRLAAWGRGPSRGGSAPSLVARVERQAVLQPEALAVEHGDQALSYQALNERANRLAHRLLDLGMGPERRVAVALERGIDSVVALLAVLKCGAAYVPLDLAYPAERIALMIEDSRAEALVCRTDLEPGLSAVVAGLPRIDLRGMDEAPEPARGNPAIALCEDSLLYILFTSGSTGRPKGIAMRHGVLSQLVDWQIARHPGAVRTLMFASPCFDVGYQEVMVALCSGAALVQTDEAQRRDFALLLRHMSDHAVERAYLPYAVLQLLAEAALGLGRTLPALRQIITAGEQLKCTAELSAWLAQLPGCELLNQYGPTETHVVSSFDVAPGDGRMLPPIGAPVSTAVLRVLDDSLQPVPPGVAGELYLGGALARGYVGQPALSAQRFVADPLAGDGGRLYRSGDLARWDDQGQLEYLGRVDHQVKVRGFRVETGEVEAALLALDGVREAVVVAQAVTGGHRLVAYVVAPPGQSVDAGLLREGLRQSLPDYMLPSVFVGLAALPLNANGKVDRARLPAPAEAVRPAHEEPLGEAETRLAQIWRDVLAVERVGRSDNFFELGGHSLLAAQMVARVQSAMQADLAVKDVFEVPELAPMARRIAASGDQDAKFRAMASFVDSLENV
jgi:amino acid adenylation domain-containing protein